ncbi:hypothetical protein [Piscinibacter terrae]|nr:hypothetical protein [Albitalea terrae]
MTTFTFSFKDGYRVTLTAPDEGKCPATEVLDRVVDLVNCLRSEQKPPPQEATTQ